MRLPRINSPEVSLLIENTLAPSCVPYRPFLRAANVACLLFIVKCERRSSAAFVSGVSSA